MIKKAVTIRANMDMESHPIAHLVQEASQYKSQVFIEMDNKKINAKSIMGIMAFNPSEGMSINIETDGSDEEEAILAIEKFLVCE